jgi:hypothetical protein
MRGGTRKRGDTWTWFFDAVDPVTGKRRQRSKGGFRTKREAQAALSEGASRSQKLNVYAILARILAAHQLCEYSVQFYRSTASILNANYYPVRIPCV